MKNINIPMWLTWLRIVLIPVLLIIYYLPVNLISVEVRDILATCAFVVAAITDWFDGWLARKLNQTSSFGAFLDPVADKLMVTAALIVLLHLGRVEGYIAFIIIGREITISALREWMAQLGATASVAVHWLGKFKTAAQMTAISMLLFDHKFFNTIDMHWLGSRLVEVAAVLTLWSMCYYLKKAWPIIKAKTD